MTKIKAKKKLGQHFLVDKNIIRKIVEAFSPKKSDLILEIGPGRGALTEELIKYSQNIILVEIDSELIQELNQKFPDLKIINKDILECDFKSEFFENKYRIIGNLPYYITSQILIKIFDNYAYINDAFIMVQKEVAQRIVASKGKKDYGILSVFAQFYSEPEILFNVSRNCFYPKPEVDSSIIQMTIKPKQYLNDLEEKVFRRLVRTAFNQRRKTLKNSLQNLFDENEVEIKNKFFALQFDFSKRAEELSLDDFIYLAKNFYGLKYTKIK
ncbi:MAG: 16S rRNA (adenine(1518)-N(6)/adenine(1519)-N(6))-dimethyltransferase RsmA [Ignavibacteria bacterium]|nr:16S rRNA (adenine(1518)-N(6)/adenine(1519)-N(6))-dimethyltransferase RsmA [Ignavibacteria bacterium]MDH7527317.1 16S rRNA (adenine(1518)-N(6)/adenine(1519)-N(6))-dimethyltransferase RsmA [Ignavibacteria bacterium]